MENTAVDPSIVSSGNCIKKLLSFGSYKRKPQVPITCKIMKQTPKKHVKPYTCSII
jgi:hypothetical protein